MVNETDVKLLARIQRNRFLKNMHNFQHLRRTWTIGHGEHEGHPDQVLLGDQRELDEGGPE